jgi:pentatricopeptide repeat protein
MPTTPPSSVPENIHQPTKAEEWSQRLKINRKMTTMKTKESELLKLVGCLNDMLSNPNFPFPDIVSFNIVIDALGKFGHLGVMIDFFCVMIEYGLRPNVITFTSMIDAYITSHDHINMYAIISLMERMGIAWNDHTRATFSKLEKRTKSPSSPTSVQVCSFSPAPFSPTPSLF